MFIHICFAFVVLLLFVERVERDCTIQRLKKGTCFLASATLQKYGFGSERENENLKRESKSFPTLFTT
jgi:hypothetical protein